MLWLLHHSKLIVIDSLQINSFQETWMLQLIIQLSNTFADNYEYQHFGRNKQFSRNVDVVKTK